MHEAGGVLGGPARAACSDPARAACASCSCVSSWATAYKLLSSCTAAQKAIYCIYAWMDERMYAYVYVCTHAYVYVCTHVVCVRESVVYWYSI
jgi:hypothetical protein